MEELHGRFRQRDFARPLEATQKIELDPRKAAPRPIDRGHDLRRSTVCVNQLRIEEELVMVPHDATAAEFAQHSMTAFGRGPNVATSPRQMTWSTPVRRISASTARSATSFAWISEIRAIRVIGMT